MVLSKLNKPVARTTASGFFNVGEWVADKSINFAKTQINSNKLDEYPLKKPREKKTRSNDQE
eukprot:gene6794-7899_t